MQTDRLKETQRQTKTPQKCKTVKTQDSSIAKEPNPFTDREILISMTYLQNYQQSKNNCHHSKLRNVFHEKPVHASASHQLVFCQTKSYSVKQKNVCFRFPPNMTLFSQYPKKREKNDEKYSTACSARTKGQLLDASRVTCHIHQLPCSF